MSSRPFKTALASSALKSFAILVPTVDRAEWLAEWHAELVFVAREDQGRPILFSVGSLQDALFLRWEHIRFAHSRRLLFPAWLMCLSRLALMLVAAYLCAQFRVGFSKAPFADIYDVRVDVSLSNAFLHLALGLAALPAMLSVQAGKILLPSRTSSGRFWQIVRFWTFMATKVLIVLTCSHYVGIFVTHTAESGAILSGANGLYKAVRDGLLPLQFLVTFITSLYGLCWALLDQQRRCPVCLNHLTQPLSRGQDGRIFLAWRQSEESCLSGHGLLIVPEILTSWSKRSSWLHSDELWS